MIDSPCSSRSSQCRSSNVHPQPSSGDDLEDTMNETDEVSTTRHRLPWQRGARSASLGTSTQSAASATRNGAAGECEHVGEAKPGMQNTATNT
jgi:hypothetical protein